MTTRACKLGQRLTPGEVEALIRKGEHIDSYEGTLGGTNIMFGQSDLFTNSGFSDPSTTGISDLLFGLIDNVRVSARSRDDVQRGHRHRTHEFHEFSRS